MISKWLIERIPTYLNYHFIIQQCNYRALNLCCPLIFSLMSFSFIGWIGGWIDNRPMGSQGGYPAVKPAADEDQLCLGMFGVHVEGIARGLTGMQGATPVGSKNHRRQMVGILSRNLDNGFSFKQLNLLGFTGYMTSNRGPDVTISKLDAVE